MIRFENVTKRYPNQSRPALDGIDLNIERGEFAFIVGASGSGKSTLVRLTIREEIVSSGRLLVGGHDLRRMPHRKVPQLRRQVGTIFQDFRLLPNKTVQQNVAYALQVIGRPRRAIRALVPETLELVGLAGMEKRMPHELSGGEQQRVAIARAVVNKPPILLADEPTGNLDPATSLDIVQLLRRIHDSGTTIVMATHDNVIVDELQKRVIELEDGHIIRDEEGGSYVPKVVDSRDRDEREAVRAHDERDHHDDGALPPQEDRPIGEVHALDEWDDDAEDLLR
ncbi:cell division ATP-binding protein FtsE [Janibacter hoylei]|uniref:Cell division ATP-binding protein FtsE n=1 Tax=Janibacter hoylei PVAS-1 TaxID=1210046 RepID=K1ETG4_9MICO|nr:cell division ATP-binding protein FtsE [Janibacter hoylei]EKA62428.1 cell division ATP-binding protein FtsE [Janibacter hoylei PVAS-1]RWU85724.1 cell division ATP-binding protein FtsE [Janibacter hoylei PVAS-1]